ncbi:MAG: hypothetical protein II814_10755 [Treponema sp.]|nr:hypothetical protein [Treponema sp.]
MKKLTITRIAKITSIAVSALFLASCSDMFQERVPMAIQTGGATIAKMFEAQNSIESLDAPKQVFVTNSEYNNAIIVSWEKVQYARSYRLERAIATEKKRTALGKFQTRAPLSRFPTLLLLRAQVSPTQ